MSANHIITVVTDISKTAATGRLLNELLCTLLFTIVCLISTRTRIKDFQGIELEDVFYYYYNVYDAQAIVFVSDATSSSSQDNPLVHSNGDKALDISF